MFRCHRRLLKVNTFLFKSNYCEVGGGGGFVLSIISETADGVYRLGVILSDDFCDGFRALAFFFFFCKEFKSGDF